MHCPAQREETAAAAAGDPPVVYSDCPLNTNAAELENYFSPPNKETERKGSTSETGTRKNGTNVNSVIIITTYKKLFHLNTKTTVFSYLKEYSS